MLLLQGCASIVSGTNQIVSVETPGCPAASCELTNDKGKWYINTTPGTTTISRAYGDLNALCRNGDVSGNATFKSSTKAMAFGNVLIGGVIGVGVDVASGAAYDYPSTLVIPMACAPKAETTAVKSADIKSRRNRLGIKAENLTAATAAAAGRAGTEGVMVTDVETSGIGESMGLKVGHIVAEMNGRTVANVEALSSELGNAEEGDVELVVLETGKRVKLGHRKGSL